mgnify:CR=1 FL=1
MVGVFVSWKAKKAREIKGIKQSAKIPKQNKPKLAEVNWVESWLNLPYLKIISTIWFLKMKMRILKGIIK